MTMVSFVKCQACDNGTIVFPAVTTYGNKIIPAREHFCLDCGGAGKFKIESDGKISYVRQSNERNTGEKSQPGN
jgi:hypothetical protein